MADVRLLGPVELHGPAGEIDVGPPQRRCLLAALAIDAGAVVAADELVRRVWGDGPPAQVRKGLQAHVARLRKALELARGVSLVNRNGGYALLLDAGATDLGRFRRLVAEGRSAAREGEDARAARCYRDAGALWRGEPLTGVDGEWVAGLRITLTDQRLTAVEAELEVRLRLDEVEAVVDEALALAKRHLGRERLVALVMRCLYRCGRQAEGLDLHTQARAFLDEAGLRPGAELTAVQQLVLRNDPSLLGRPPEHSPASRPERADAWRHDLAREMRRLWPAPDIGGVGGRLELRVRELPGALRRPFTAHTNSDDLGPSGRTHSASRLADLLLGAFNRRMLLLGDKGAGKTTCLLKLAADLLDRVDDSDVPVPVVLLLSRWDRRPDLTGWIVEELRDQYRLRADRARRLLEDGELVVMLDGLDEVPEAVRRSCAEAIDAFRTQWPTGIVVSSRTREYGELGIRLAVGGAVVLEPLTAAQIDARLAAGGAPLAGLRARARCDPALVEQLSTPHMLDVVCVGHLADRADGTSAPPGGTYDRYLTALLERDRAPRPATSGRPPPFDPRTTLRHLVWLARLMTARAQTLWYPDHLMPADLPDDRWPWPVPAGPVVRAAGRGGLRGLATAATYGSAAAVLCGSMYGLQLWLGRGSGVEGTALDASPWFAALVALVVFATVTAVFTAPVRRAGRWPRGAAYAVVLLVAGGLHKGLSTARAAGETEGWWAGVSGAVVHGASTAASTALGLGVALLLLRLGEADGPRAGGRHGEVGRPGGPGRWARSRHRVVLGADVAVACAAAVGISHAVARYAAAPHDGWYALLTGLAYGVMMGLGGGVLLGLAFFLVDLDVVRPAAQWRLSVPRLGRALVGTAVFGLVHWLLFVHGVGLLLGPDKGPLFSLVLGVTFCLTFALGHSLVPDHALPVPAPARALVASLRAARGPVAAAVLVAFLASAATRPDVLDYVQLALVVPALLAAQLTFWFTGGGVWLAHHVARRVAHAAGILPADLLGFLDHADERMLLDRIGGGYRFRHPELQRHVAVAEPVVPPP